MGNEDLATGLEETGATGGKGEHGSLLRNLSYNGGVIRTVILQGHPWFVARDVCDALGLVDATTAMRGLDDDEKTKMSVQTEGGLQELNVVDESGLYALAFVSRKKEARKFRKWVTREVLPSLRKGPLGNMPPAAGPGRFNVTIGLDGRIASINQDETTPKDYQILELEALAHAFLLIGKLWQRFELVDRGSSLAGRGGNTRYQLSAAIKQAQHLAASAMRTRMAILGGLGRSPH